jgi:alkylation response protein AidB-like acyl-CoA dehydrogenase
MPDQLATRTQTEAAIERSAALADEFALTAAHYDRTGEFPFANFERLNSAGLLKLTVPVRYGGMEAGLDTTCRVVQAIARGEPSTALVLAMHCIYHAVARHAGWDESVHSRMCQESIDGIALINVMRVEPELGTPTRGGLPATQAERTANGWRLSGRKLYSTGSPILRYFVTWARTTGDDPRVGWFAVPRDAQGWRIEETWDHTGMRATGSHDLVLEGVEIPEEFAVDLRMPGDWLPPDPVQGAWNNLVLAALYHGVATAARDWLTGYLHERVPANLGQPLASLPRFQHTVGEIETLLWTSERLIHGLAAECDSDPAGPAASQTAMAKTVATNNAVRAVDLAMSLVGNPGLSRHNPLERHHRDVLCSRIHMPQDDMVFTASGTAALETAQRRNSHVD